MARVPYVSYTFGGEPKLRVGSGQGRSEPAKHGVAFVDAQLAFLDPARVIAKDLSHSKGEPRFYALEKLVAACSPYGLHTVAM